LTAISPLAEFFVPVGSWGDLSNEAVTAEGSRVTFADGSEAICAVSGLWNASLGYGNRAIADAMHESNLRASALPLFRRGSTIAREAARALLEFAHPHEFATCWFSTSGSAALDTTVKLVRQYQALRGEVARKRIVSFSGSYHGMTAGAMATTGEYLQQDVYGIDQRLHIRVPHDDPDAFERVASRYGHELAAVILEPVLGSGAFVVDESVIDTILKWRATHGFAVVADEVATGFHRTGPRFASHGWKEQPDIVVTSKALTNGTCAAAALLASPAILGRFREAGAVFWHGETQAGSPQSSAAVLATIREFDRLDVARQSARVSERLDGFLAELSSASNRLTTTGAGCFRGIHLRDEGGDVLASGKVAEVVGRARSAGVIIQPGPSCVQLIPNLVMSDDDLDELFQRLNAVFRDWLDDTR
jgi:adenosylmethionine-8-amino-7-oxononanoate aminotransferase